MRRCIYSFLLIAICVNGFSQIRFKTIFPKSAATLQYAGSTGFLSIGYSLVTPKSKGELGITYGFVPRSVGGVNHSINIKGTYNPFHLKVYKQLFFEPVQSGLFLSQNFNEDLGITWEKKYPKGYYPWRRSLRLHIFMSSQVSFLINKKHIEKIACYFEANTNDLYVKSYFPNRQTMSFYDIIFFGIGTKVYLR